MPTTLESVVTKYLRSGSPAQRTREEYATTLRKLSRWGGEASLEHLGRKEIREFLDWVHEDAVSREATNPGRIANKARSHLRAVLSWAWEHDLVDALPRFPRLKPQRDVAGRHYLTKPELNALYFACELAEVGETNAQWNCLHVLSGSITFVVAFRLESNSKRYGLP